jgi:HSP20 family protein
MVLGKWDPFNNLATLQDRINHLFDNAFPQSDDPDEDLAACTWRPMVDIFETDSGVALLMDLPGVDKNDLSVEIKENVLTIKGQRAIETAVTEDRYYRRERSCGAFQRSFAMRAMVAPDAINATFKNGVLKIELPRPEQERLKPVNVNID